MVIAEDASVDASVAVPATGWINVLELGAKNDGSEDVSDIVNVYTEKGALFFPAGRYKVSRPIILKNPIFGEGYARTPDTMLKDGTRTWFVSDIECSDNSVGVFNFSGGSQVNIQRLNIVCHSQECGIRIEGCSQGTATFISEVGIFDVSSYGIFMHGGGSRPIFAQNMTIFGSGKHPVPGVGIHNGTWVCDNRFSNIEMMGVRIGLEVDAGYTYGNNLHLWTGCMGQHDNGSWWRGTRGIVVNHGGTFVGSEIYPDSCFFMFEQLSQTSAISIHNLIYWEDSSMKESPDYDGAFFHCAPGVTGNLFVDGGIVGVVGNDEHPGRMEKVYTPGQNIRNVMIRSDYSICGKNIDRLCLGDELPDYSVSYSEKGFCKVADIFTVAEIGACEAKLVSDDGAVFTLKFQKKGSLTTQAVPENEIAADRQIKFVEKDGVVSVYLNNPDASEMTVRFTTAFMCPRFRPVNYATLRGNSCAQRYHDVLTE